MTIEIRPSTEPAPSILETVRDFTPAVLPPSPEEVAPTVYHDAQTMVDPRTGEPLFDDSKTMADREWQRPLPYIEADYLKAKRTSDIATNPDTMRAFLDTHFGPLPVIDNLGVRCGGTALKYVEDKWYGDLYADLSKYTPSHGPGGGSTLILSPDMANFTANGGRYGNPKLPEHYGWDPRFTMSGQAAGGFWDLARGNLTNARVMINRDGYVRNGNRLYYQRPQLPETAHMVRMLAVHDGPEAYRQNLPTLLIEYNTWMEGADDPEKLRAGACRSARLMPDGVSILNDLWDDQGGKPRLEGYREDIRTAEEARLRGYTSDEEYVYRGIRKLCALGHDMSTRGMAGVDLASVNADDILFMEPQARLLTLEETIRDAYLIKAKDATDLEEIRRCYEEADRFRQYAINRRAAIQKYMWDEDRGFYFDYNMRTQRRTDIWSIGVGSMLESGVPSQRQADRVIAVIEDKCLKIGGLLTTLDLTEHNWTGDRAWSFTHLSAVQGMFRYGKQNPNNARVAHRTAGNWAASQEAVKAKYGFMVEKTVATVLGRMAGGAEYVGHVEGVELPCVPGFAPTNGVYATFEAGAYDPDVMRRLAQESQELRWRYPGLPQQMGLTAMRQYAVSH